LSALSISKDVLALGIVINGLTETAARLQRVVNSQLPQKSLPNVYQLVKEAINGHNFEIGHLSLPKLAAAETVTTSSGINYPSVMTTLAQAVTICLAEKAVAEDRFLKYTKVLNNC
jgi:hypothetical protein